MYVTDPDCQVAETIIIEEAPPSCASTIASTPSTSGTIQSEQSYFRFPPRADLVDVTNNVSQTSYLCDVTNDVTNEDSAYFSCPSNQYTPSIPPTPSTASSVDSSSPHIPSFLKQGLKHTIQARRLQEGKGMLKVEFKEPEPECVSIHSCLKQFGL